MKFKKLKMEDKEFIRDALSEENWKALNKLFEEILEAKAEDVANTSVERGFDDLQRNKLRYDGYREFIQLIGRARSALRKP